MIILYKAAIKIYTTGIRIASLWNRKASAWTEGRKEIFAQLGKKIMPGDRIIWIHCSSAGEYEQGKPLIAEMKKQYPRHRLLVTFFSPSGYRMAEKNSRDHLISYLPEDTAGNANHFLNMVNPELAVFIKYEFWHYHLKAIHRRKIPLILVSAIFRPGQIFFRSYGSFFLRQLAFFDHIFVQDRRSWELLNQNGISQCSVSGDTRFDRVAFIARHFEPVQIVEFFISGTPALVAGSTWPGDEKILADALKGIDLKLVIAPHETGETHISRLQQLFPGAMLYSQMSRLFTGTETEHAAPVWNRIEQDEKEFRLRQFREARVLIIDTVGLLSRLYYYGQITYTGGGFTRDGIHNILEAAVYGKPVIFGPRHGKYREAGELISCGGAVSVQDATSLAAILEIFMDEKAAGRAGSASREFVQRNTGATAKIISHIQTKRLLIS